MSEQQQRQQADRARPDEAELVRRREQSRRDREAHAIEDAVHRTVYGGDVNMMDANDW
jgi:hypothetical protein